MIGRAYMCTAVTYKTKDFYFGRTLDYDCSFGEEITITPRNFPLHFRKEKSMDCHYAIIGMAHVEEEYPLYYDAINEKGLAMAGLNFVGNAYYEEKSPEKYSISPFEFIPWILGQCATVKEAKKLISDMDLVNIPFSKTLPLAELHWIIADLTEAVTVEAMKDGIHIYENAVGVLTNNPPFESQMFQLNNYMHLSAKEPENHFSDKIALKAYSRGMGAIGLPGDLSSQSRFVRASFIKINSISGDSEMESVNQFFHILESVQQQRGCCDLGNDKYEMTLYTSCCNAERGIYYYTTYENHQITAVHMYHEKLEGRQLIRYPLICGEHIQIQN